MHASQRWVDGELEADDERLLAEALRANPDSPFGLARLLKPFVDGAGAEAACSEEAGRGVSHPSFARRLAELRAFRREHGHADVPERTHGALSRWVRRLRARAHAGLLPPAEAAVLAELGVSGAPRRVGRPSLVALARRGRDP